MEGPNFGGEWSSDTPKAKSQVPTWKGSYCSGGTSPILSRDLSGNLQKPEKTDAVFTRK